MLRAQTRASIAKSLLLLVVVMAAFYLMLFLLFDPNTKARLDSHVEQYLKALRGHSKTSPRIVGDRRKARSLAEEAAQYNLHPDIRRTDMAALLGSTKRRGLAAAPLGLYPPEMPLSEDSQCGGEGGLCPITVDCRDAPWDGYQCPAGFFCGRRSVWTWRCLKNGEPEGPYQCPAVLSLATSSFQPEQGGLSESFIATSPATELSAAPVAALTTAEASGSVPVKAPTASPVNAPTASPVSAPTVSSFPPLPPVGPSGVQHQPTANDVSLQAAVPLSPFPGPSPTMSPVASLTGSPPMTSGEAPSPILLQAPTPAASNSSSASVPSMQDDYSLASSFQACGGLGSDCKLASICKDMQWAACPPDAYCQRYNKYFWSCAGSGSGRRL